jgi:hypothetical protein
MDIGSQTFYDHKILIVEIMVIIFFKIIRIKLIENIVIKFIFDCQMSKG